MVYQNLLWNQYKSEGERRIGTYLKDRQIDFTYERPVAIIDNSKAKLWYPDFYLTDYHILIEYLGMNGNPHNAKVNDYKRRIYKENKFDLIEIYPTDFKENWQAKIDAGIYTTLERRIKDYTSRSHYHTYQAKPAKKQTQMSFKFYP